MNFDFTDNFLNNIDTEHYQQIVRSLLYFILDTWSDIAQAVRILIWFITSSRIQHEQVFNKIFRYLNEIKFVDILFKTETDLKLFDYTNINFADNIQENRCLISDYIFFLADRLIFWISKCQFVVAINSIETEYIDQYNAVWKSVWIRSFFKELRFRYFIMKL